MVDAEVGENRTSTFAPPRILGKKRLNSGKLGDAAQPHRPPKLQSTCNTTSIEAYDVRGEKLVCPECGSGEVVRAGKRFYNGLEIQRFLCKDCEIRFSDPMAKHFSFSEKINKGGMADKDVSQICAVLQDAKNLDPATETKTVAGEVGKTQQEAKGKIVELCLNMKRQGYSEETIRLNRIALKVLMERGADLFNSDSVKDVISKQSWSPNRKKNVINAYTMFLKLNKMTWEPPRCVVTKSIPFIPTEQEIDALISAAPKKLSTFLFLLKETAMRRGEAKRLKWIDIDSERNTITLNEPEKRSNPRMWKVSPQLIAQLNALSQTSERVFGDCKMDSLKSAFLHLRRKQAAKLQNPRLLNIGFHTLRHWKATMLYHRTKDALFVRDFLGHKSMKNTEKYITIERKMFADYGDDEFTVKMLTRRKSLRYCLKSASNTFAKKTA